MRILRHDIPNPMIVQKNFERSYGSLSKVLKYCQARSAGLNGVLNAVWDIVLYGAVVEPHDSKLIPTLLLGAQAGAALFRVREAGEQQIEFKLGEGPPLISNGPVGESVCHPGTWLKSIQLAILSRERSLINSLCKVPTQLLRQSSTRGPEFHYLFVDAVKSFWSGAADTSARNDATLAATDPSRSDITVPEYNAHHWLPEIELLACLHSRPADFPEALLKAVILHGEFYNSTDERRRDSYGFLAVRPLTWAAVAHDRGIRFDIDSEYLPMRLVVGDLSRKSTLD
jgi:hypothetical protein